MVASAAEKAPATASGGTRRVLLFPLPFQGHLNPMLQLADVLHARGLRVTVFHAAFNAPDPACRPAGYRFVPVGAGVPTADLVPTGSNADFAGALLRINERLQAPFQNSLREALEDEEGVPACLVLDSNLRGMQVVADRLGVPTLVLRTGGAACLVAYMAFPALCDKGLLPPQDHSQLNMALDDLPPLQLQDMVFSTTTPHETMTTCLERIVESAKCSSGVILNTFNDLEDVELQKIVDGVCVPVYAIGPLYKISSGAQSSLLSPDQTCLDWLDKQEAQSVLFVSFGSLASMDQEELGKVGLPDGFEEETQGRGMVVSWAPQQDVLGHQAVGGFWTHNGWNSTLESICEGVPMICRPHFADQMINARYVEEVWKVGFELVGKLERGNIERGIRKLLREEEGGEMRRRANDLKDKAIHCIKKGGSSQTMVDLLVNCIMSLPSSI
ncbi:DIMBOA UDP-glucosyltransferase BX8-like isoform X2 [Triticum dicoccoides]|uniref:DIMBOA UDP-glucosyltransferase BX8-like isoform X2 n=1 Tax=Triticum dicoccoides TaxID=85692 RepID=UPI001890A9C2|nr:DIMBOA UDP-glucosyltransferase BX8-like isoform X2 [Triticum dicoccoides]